MKKYQHLLLVLLVGLGTGSIRAQEAPQTKAADAEGHQWWQHAVFYEIYPRSFEFDAVLIGETFTRDENVSSAPARS